MGEAGRLLSKSELEGMRTACSMGFDMPASEAIRLLAHARALAERAAALENALRAVEDAWEYETDDPGVGDGVFLSNMLRVVMPQVKAALDAAREEAGE